MQKSVQPFNMRDGDDLSDIAEDRAREEDRLWDDRARAAAADAALDARAIQEAEEC